MAPSGGGRGGGRGIVHSRNPYLRNNKSSLSRFVGPPMAAPGGGRGGRRSIVHSHII